MKQENKKRKEEENRDGPMKQEKKKRKEEENRDGAVKQERKKRKEEENRDGAVKWGVRRRSTVAAQTSLGADLPPPLNHHALLTGTFVRTFEKNLNIVK